MRQQLRGFTLLELMIVVTLGALLFGIGVPSMINLVRNGRMTSAANDFMAALHYARSEAIKRRIPVTVCTSANALDAAPTCANSDTLSGWIVFVDNAADGQPNGADIIIAQHAALPDTITARSSANPLRVTYLDTGFAQTATSRDLVMCDSRGNVPSAGALSAARGITISATGRAEVTREQAAIASLITRIGGSIGGCGS